MASAEARPDLAGKAVTGGRVNADAAVAAITSDAVPTPTPTATPEPTPEPTPTATPVPPAPPAPPVPAPTVTPVASLFDVSVGGSLTTKRSKLRVRYSLTKAATVRFGIAKRGSKRPLSAWTKKGRSGVNSVIIARRLPTGKTLKRGSYKLSVGLNATVTSSWSIRVR